MGFLQKALKPFVQPAFERLARAAGIFDLQVMAAARSIAASGQHSLVHPADFRRVSDPKQLRVALLGNVANHAYNAAKCLRRLGFQADLVLHDGWTDAFVMSRPFWEEVDVECRSYEEGLSHEKEWTPPSFVRHVRYDEALGMRYARRFDAVPVVQSLYRETFGKELSIDRALLLAQHMAYWPMLVALHEYDVVQLSSGSVALAPFLSRPYVIFPTGGELYISPFEETLQGLLYRAAYRNANHVLLCETDYPRYLDRLDTGVSRSFSPLMMDTDTYQPGSAEPLREKWKQKVGGERFLVGVCRQSWEWKGSDRLIRAFARFHRGPGSGWRLILLEWGDDIARSKALVTELGLTGAVVWEPLCSKPMLRVRQRAADLVADQFVMEGYGASVLESMAAGKAVLMAPAPPESTNWLPEAPPFLGARTEDEIVAALEQVKDDAYREQLGQKSLAWVRKVHGYQATVTGYQNGWLAALGMPLPVSELGSANPLREGMLVLHQRLRARMKEQFNRSLPLADELTDRWERARFLGFGEGASIYDSALVLGDVRVGAHTWVGPGCILDGSGGLQVGAWCSLAAGVHLYSHDTVDWAVSAGVAPYKRSPTRIGDACYLGPHAVVTAGVSIGKHSIVGALSMVKEDVPDYSFVAGSPARVMGRVEVDASGAVRIVRTQAEQKGIQNG